jgi:hypothetical protein
MPEPPRQLGLAVIVLLVVLVAVGWVAVPFKDGAYQCSPAIWTAWRGREVLPPPLPVGAIVPTLPSGVRCKAPARNRASNSASVIVLAVGAFIVVRRRDRARVQELLRSSSN